MIYLISEACQNKNFSYHLIEMEKKKNNKDKRFLSLSLSQKMSNFFYCAPNELTD